MLDGSIDERIDLGHACNALQKNTRHLTSLMRNVTAPESPAIGTWSIHDVAIHVTDGMENYARRIQRQPASELDAIRDMARWNVETVDRLPRTPLPELADRMERAADDFIVIARSMEPHDQVPWYAGFSIPVVVSVSLRLVEHIIHGYDIAMTARHPWPIDRDDAVEMTYGLAYTSPHFVDPDRLNFEGTIKIHIRGERPFFFVIQRRELRVQTSNKGRVGFHISADPVAWVLASTERMRRASAALTGRIIGWGFRPLMPFKLQAASFQG